MSSSQISNNPTSTPQNSTPSHTSDHSNTSHSSQISSIAPLELIGSRIKLLDIQNNEIVGDIYAYDPNLELLILYESGDQHESSRRKSFRTIHANKGIKQIISLEKPSNPTVPFYDSPLPKLNLDKIEGSIEKSLQERKKRFGVGVTFRAQHFFDLISKNIPNTTWDEKEIGTIVLLDETRITEPYRSENIHTKNEQSKNLLTKILDGENKKIDEEMRRYKSENNSGKNQNKQLGQKKDWDNKKKQGKQTQ